MKIKKMFLSGLFSILYTAALALSMPVNAASVTKYELHGLHNFVYTSRQTVQSSGSEESQSGALSSGIYFSNFNAGSFNYYNQLNGMQKSVYDAMKVITPTTQNLNIKFQYTDGVPDNAALVKIMQGALDALFCDCPEIFWLDIEKCKFSLQFEGVYNPTITIEFQPALKKELSSSASSLANQVQSAAGSISAGGSNRYQKLKSIHDSLAKRVQYDYDALEYYEQYGTISDNAELSFDVYGALVKGKAVCQGYAMAFKLLCDRENIPCIVVAGDAYISKNDTPIGHMWNAVQMEDGKWYNVDVTWDDQSPIVYDFFLAGSDSLAPVFTSLKFSESHRASGDFSGRGYKVFSYPAISKFQYGVSQPITTTTTVNTATTSTEKQKPVVVIPKPAPSVKPPNVIATTAPQGKTASTTAKKAPVGVVKIEISGQTVTGTSENTSTTQTESASSSAEDTEGTETSAINEEVSSPNQWNSGTVIIIVGAAFVLASAGVLIFILTKTNSSRSKQD